MPAYLAAILLSGCLAASVLLFLGRPKRWPRRRQRILGGCGLFFALLLSLYLAATLLLLGKM